MKHVFIIIWMSAALCCGAENAATTELVRPILEASNKSFPDFVRAVTAVELPPLPLPNNDEPTSPIDAVSALVWKRLSTMDVVVTPANKAEKLEVMHSMGRLYGWLLKRDAYANLVFAVYVEESVTMSALSALAGGEITTEEARKLLASLTPDITVKSMLSMVQQTAPQSKALEKMKIADPARVKLQTISDMLQEEPREHGVKTVEDLAGKENPYYLAFSAALSSTSKGMATFLIEYSAKGGDLNVPKEHFAKEMKRLMPEAIGVVDPASGVKIEAIMFGLLMENVTEWKARQ